MKKKLEFIAENEFPRQRCVAQRIETIMVAGGNHTTIQCALARNDVVKLIRCADFGADS